MDKTARALLEILPDAALIVGESGVLALSAAGKRIFPALAEGDALPAELAPFAGADRCHGACRIAGTEYEVTASRAGEKRAVCLVPLEREEMPGNVLPQLRQRLQDAMAAEQADERLVLKCQLLQLQRLLDNAELCRAEENCRKQTLDLRQLCQDIADEAGPLLALRQVTLAFECEAPLLMLWGDAYQLQALLLNLLSNAAKYGRAIRVELKKSREAALLSVTDDGGQKKGGAEKLFGHTRSLPSPETGAGLGLRACEKIACAHGGALMALPMQGGGIRVTVSLPVTERTGTTLHASRMEFDGGMSRALLGLSDVLPPQAFNVDDEE